MSARNDAGRTPGASGSWPCSPACTSQPCGRARPSRCGARTVTCPRTGWGWLTLEKSRPEVNRRWSDTDSAHDERGLKHRAATETRRVPIPPELVAILREHIDTFGTEPDGRIFASERGHVVASTAISDVWETRSSASSSLKR